MKNDERKASKLIKSVYNNMKTKIFMKENGKKKKNENEK